MNVGRDEGKGKFGIALVLGQVKADAADDVPDGAVLSQVALKAVFVGLRLGSKRRSHLGPQLDQQRRRQKLGARHGGHGLNQGRHLIGFGVGNDQRRRFGRIERTAHPRDECPPDIAPEGQLRRQPGRQLRRAEVQHDRVRDPR